MKTDKELRMDSSKKWIIISAVMGFLGVALGAFGAHSLKPYIDPDKLDVYKTGTHYQMIHAVVMLATAFLGDKIYLKAEKFFLAGIILFSFSLYLYSITSIVAFAMVTPVGGVSFLTGWAVLIVEAARR
ncbi:MAG TPA: DUF423 domain-containing protein [Ignavibacteria bacterium]|nr:DUF423 domain-containing protein [Ignavibacteria bacterium]HMR38895.1 DUF423 domain-containing protein [Ignavibacteria bacterium]